MNVFVAIVGETYEGFRVHGIFSNCEKAIASLKEKFPETHFDYVTDLMKDEVERGYRFRIEKKDDGDYYEGHSYDYALVREEEVQ